ncbi:MAG: PQQ-binding-like beta-propeller repeat protein [Ignavibacteria bacterium]
MEFLNRRTRYIFSFCSRWLCFFGSKDYKIYCLNASSGGFVWSFPTGGEVESSPAIYNGYVYVGSDDGWFYCMDIATGLPIWVSLVGGKVPSSPLVVNGYVFVGSGASCFWYLQLPKPSFHGTFYQLSQTLH